MGFRSPQKEVVSLQVRGRFSDTLGIVNGTVRA